MTSNFEMRRDWTFIDVDVHMLIFDIEYGTVIHNLYLHFQGQTSSCKPCAIEIAQRIDVPGSFALTSMARDVELLLFLKALEIFSHFSYTGTRCDRGMFTLETDYFYLNSGTVLGDPGLVIT